MQDPGFEKAQKSRPKGPEKAPRTPGTTPSAGVPDHTGSGSLTAPPALCHRVNERLPRVRREAS